MVKYYQATTLVLLLNPQINRDGTPLQCEAFAPPLSTRTPIATTHANNNNYNSRLFPQYQVPIRKSGIIGLNYNYSNHDDDTANIKLNDEKDITILNSSGGDKLSILNTNTQQRRNEKMRQDHSHALLWTSRHVDKQSDGNSNNSNSKNSVNVGLLEEASGLDEREVENVAELLLQVPPSLGQDDEGREGLLSLKEKRRQIVMASTANAKKSGGEKHGVEQDVQDEELIHDAESVLDIINETEAQIMINATVEVDAKEGGSNVGNESDVDSGAAVKLTETNIHVDVTNDTPLEQKQQPIQSKWLPKPPKTPPTNHAIDHNSKFSIQHLAEINTTLEETLASQKSDLDGLRSKIRVLQGELRQAANLKVERDNDNDQKKLLQDQVDATTKSLKEEFDKRVSQANKSVLALQDQVDTLTRELNDQIAKYESSLQEKQQIEADYNQVTKSNTDLQRLLHNETSDWQTKLEQMTNDTHSLEQKLVEYQEESARWKKKYMDKTTRLDETTAHIKELQHVMDEGMVEIRSKQANIGDIVQSATEEERSRSQEELKRLTNEYDVRVAKQSKKIGELRTTLRSANVKRRRLERTAQREKSAALKVLRLELSSEIDSLKNLLAAKEEVISNMSLTVQDVEVAREEKERVYAELMFLSKSFQSLQSSLESSTKSYEERIQNYEEEAAVKEELILDLRKELEVAQEKIRSLEAQVASLTAELVEERRKNEELTAVVNSLRNEMKTISSNADGFESVISILRSEKDAYERQLVQEQGNVQSLKTKKAELEELIRKTKDSLVMEKERVAKDMSAKDSRIAEIDQELAKRMKENKTLKKTLKQTTNRYNSEQARVERLNSQLQKARLNIPVTNAGHAGADEIESINGRIDELSKSTDEYKSMLSKAESKMKTMTQQLLLSNQHVLKKQGEIARLKSELSAAESSSADASQGTLQDTISALTAELEELKSSASMQRDTANVKLNLVNLKLEEKEADVLSLQSKIEELLNEKKANSENKPAVNESEVGKISELQSSIETLQSSLRNAQVKAKEKIQLKNQSLQEKENTIEKLKADIIDLQSEKDKIAEKLKLQVQRSEDDYLSHELQLKNTEERLVKENLVAIDAMEKEMKKTVYQLEMEVKTLKKKVSDGDRIGSSANIAQAKRMQALEDALRQSKEQKVSLLKENMEMRHRIDNLQYVQAKASKETASSVPVKVVVDQEKEKDVPTYFTEKQRPLVIRVARKAWRKVFSRKKL